MNNENLAAVAEKVQRLPGEIRKGIEVYEKICASFAQTTATTDFQFFIESMDPTGTLAYGQVKIEGKLLEFLREHCEKEDEIIPLLSAIFTTGQFNPSGNGLGGSDKSLTTRYTLRSTVAQMLIARTYCPIYTSGMNPILQNKIEEDEVRLGYNKFNYRIRFDQGMDAYLIPMVLETTSGIGISTGTSFSPANMYEKQEGLKLGRLLFGKGYMDEAELHEVLIKDYGDDYLHKGVEIRNISGQPAVLVPISPESIVQPRGKERFQQGKMATRGDKLSIVTVRTMNEIGYNDRYGRLNIALNPMHYQYNGSQLLSLINIWALDPNKRLSVLGETIPISNERGHSSPWLIDSAPYFQDEEGNQAYMVYDPKINGFEWLMSHINARFGDKFSGKWPLMATRVEVCIESFEELKPVKVVDGKFVKLSLEEFMHIIENNNPSVKAYNVFRYFSS